MVKAAAKKAKRPPAPATAKKIVIPGPDRATLALLEEALGGRPGLRPGKMFGCPGFFLGAKAVAVVFGDDVSITLPQPQIDDLIAPGPASGYRPFIAGGRRMSGWMLIDAERVAALGADAAIYDDAIAYARAKAERAPAKARKAAPRKTAAARNTTSGRG